MGKKRKAGGRYGELKAAEKDDFKLALNTYEDVADSEDEFHINRDKVLLYESPAAKKSRKWREEDNFLEASDEEVLDYWGLEDNEDDDKEDEAEFDENDGFANRTAAVDSKAGVPEGEDDEDEDMGGWGASKRDYYNADAIETEQDALDEEAEALRIQKKQLAAMTEADFGFDEDDWLAHNGETGADSGKVVTEVLPQLQITNAMTEQEKLKLLRNRYPEFEPISKEFLQLQPLHDELAAAASAAEDMITLRVVRPSSRSEGLSSTPMAVTKYRACAAYLAAMSMYFAVMGSTAKDGNTAVIALDPAELHKHPVMGTLLKCQKIWRKVENLPIADPMVNTVDGEEITVIEETSPVVDTVGDAAASESQETRPKKSTSQRTAEAAQAKSEARRAKKLRQTEEELASLAALTNSRTLTTRKTKKPDQPKLNLLNADDSDFGEETEFTAHDLAEKARKKKSLRFYTSQIAQKANKRDAAGKDYGGDTDIPHRERLKDRQARMQAQAEKKGQNKGAGPGVALGEGGNSSDEGNADDVRPADFEDDEGYYDMVAAHSTAKKQAKLDRASAFAQAAKEGGIVIPEETIGEDGRRQITYMIEKNKGLTPHRKKSVRNPRVKKKLKFEAKKKKLKSMKPVFDAQKKAMGSANYGGELTGINKGLVRSRKL